MHQVYTPGRMRSPGQAGKFLMGIEGLSWHIVGFQPRGFFHLLGIMLVMVPQEIFLALGVEWVFSSR